MSHSDPKRKPEPKQPEIPGVPPEIQPIPEKTEPLPQPEILPQEKPEKGNPVQPEIPGTE